MTLSLTGLAKLCNDNIVELKFNRRLRFKGLPATRRMLATLDSTLLNSTVGKEILNFKPPTQNTSYNASQRGLLTVWDILFQDWRNIPIESTVVVTAVPTKPQEEFWKYFDSVIRKMTSKQKEEFMKR
jgi:hypothetical protein